MRVQDILACDFIPYQRLDLRLAPTGLTLVTGRNGAGKSTIPEALAWALYGKTIRGAVHKKASVTVTLTQGARECKVLRLKDGRTGELTFSVDGNQLTAATVSETQRRICDVIGTWERFCFTRVFTREFATKFGSATDKERKELLEEVLGLGHFDRASALARQRVATTTQALTVAKSNAALLEGTVGEAKRSVEEACVGLGDTAEMERSLKAATASLAEAQKRGASLREVLKDAVSVLDEAKSRRMDLRRQLEYSLLPAVDKITARLAEIERMKHCPSCDQDVGEDHKAIIRHRMILSREGVEKEVARVTSDLVDADAVLSEAQENYAILSGKTSANSSVVQDLGRDIQNLTMRLQVEKVREESAVKARAALAAAIAKSQKLRETVDLLLDQLAVEEAAVDALGIRGARVMLLARALGRLEAETNRVLQRLGLGMQIRLAAQAQLRSGKTVDTLEIRVEGAGGGDYCACSSGERARIDVALLLGLAAVADDAGFVVFDEVFDALDREGVERVSMYLEELAQTRQVIVITHHEDFIANFPRARLMSAQRDGDKPARLEE